MDGGEGSLTVLLLLWALAGGPAGGRGAPDVCSSCHVDATCDDKADGAGKVCNCKYGFVGNGRTFCQDKDECQIGANKICGQHTTCHNTYGSYFCTCLGGYSPSNNMAVFIPNDGTHCQDVDECRVPGVCGPGARCRNLDGAFDCSCLAGHRAHGGAEPFHPRDQTTCRAVDCGPPGPVHGAVLQTLTGTSFGSEARFVCDEGLAWRGGDGRSVCGAGGRWGRPAIVCEAKCGPLPAPANSEVLWHNRSVALHGCVEGYYSWTGGNVSVCGDSGVWQEATLVCKAECGSIPAPANSEVLWRNSSVALLGCVEGYYSWTGGGVSVCGDSGVWQEATLVCKADCGPLPVPDNSEVLWRNRSVAVYRCVEGYHSWRGSNVSVCNSAGRWQEATLKCIEKKPPITQLATFNEKCLRWNAEKYEADTEVYKVVYTGSRDYQRSFRDKGQKHLASKDDRLKLCLDLLPVTNYSISVTATSTGFAAAIATNTSMPVPPTPLVYYQELETPLPTLRLFRSPNTLDSLSSYQVLVVPAGDIVTFHCSSPPSSDPLRYVTAQLDLRQVGTEMNFTVGDGRLYGGFYNAPLESVKDYYIVLRAVCQWKTNLKSSCVLWAKVIGTSYILRVSSLCAAVFVALATLFVLGGFGFIWCAKKTRQI